LLRHRVGRFVDVEKMGSNVGDHFAFAAASRGLDKNRMMGRKAMKEACIDLLS
jgi:hypothetical protein